MLNRILTRPEILFLWLAIPFGLLFLAFTPPLFGADEVFHFERTAMIAYGHVLNEPAAAPSGILRFMNEAFFAYTFQHPSPPFHYPLSQYATLLAIPLHDGPPAMLPPTIYTTLHPIAYLPQVIAFRLGACLDLPPLALLYLARAAGLASGILLSFLALSRMPHHRFLLLALTLLPTTVFFMSHLNADTVTNGLSFLLIAEILRAAAGKKPLGGKDILRIALIAFLQSQCKSVYLLLPCFALILPSRRFASVRARVLSLAVIILPGVAGSLLWAQVVHATYFAGMHYHTLSGEAWPDAQMAFILHHPLSYAGVLLRTVFAPTFPGNMLLGLTGYFGGGVHLPLFVCVLLLALFFAVLALDTTGVPPPLDTRLLAAGLFAGGLLLGLTALYVQWTALYAPHVDGFFGRYLIPILPLVFLFAGHAEGLPRRPLAGMAAGALGAVGLGVACVSAMLDYFG